MTHTASPNILRVFKMQTSKWLLETEGIYWQKYSFSIPNLKKKYVQDSDQ